MNGHGLASLLSKLRIFRTFSSLMVLLNILKKSGGLPSFILTCLFGCLKTLSVRGGPTGHLTPFSRVHYDLHLSLNLIISVNSRPHGFNLIVHVDL